VKFKSESKQQEDWENMQFDQGRTKFMRVWESYILQKRLAWIEEVMCQFCRVSQEIFEASTPITGLERQSFHGTLKLFPWAHCW
jgi:hypothetical protein